MLFVNYFAFGFSTFIFIILVLYRYTNIFIRFTDIFYSLF